MSVLRNLSVYLSLILLEAISGLVRQWRGGGGSRYEYANGTAERRGAASEEGILCSALLSPRSEFRCSRAKPVARARHRMQRECRHILLPNPNPFWVER